MFGDGWLRQSERQDDVPTDAPGRKVVQDASTAWGSAIALKASDVVVARVITPSYSRTGHVMSIDSQRFVAVQRQKHAKGSVPTSPPQYPRAPQ